MSHPEAAGRCWSRPHASGPQPNSRTGNLSIATPPAPYRSLHGPSGPEPQKVSKRVSQRLPAQRSKKCPKQSQISLRSLKKLYFETPETVFRLFRTLFRPRGRKTQGDSLGDFLGFRARRAREPVVRGERSCNLSIQIL